MNENKNLIPFILLSLVTLFPFSSQAGTLAFETIDQGDYSGYTKKDFLVIKTMEEWQKVWSIHASAKLPLPELPVIDFNNQMLIAVFAGEYSSGGYSIRIDNVDKTKKVILVTIVQAKPERNAITGRALTQPYQIVQIEKTDLPIEFVEK